jgi:hypothetical protein
MPEESRKSQQINQEPLLGLTDLRVASILSLRVFPPKGILRATVPSPLLGRGDTDSNMAALRRRSCGLRLD